MTKRARRTLAVVIVLGAATVAAAPGTPNFHPVPEVLVVHVPPTMMGVGTIFLQNDEAFVVNVGSITRAASCDAEVTATVAQGPPFDVGEGSAVPLTIHCAAGTNGMKRCLFHVNDAVNSPYFDTEGVCEYGSMPSLGPSMQTINFGNVMVGGSASQPMSVHNNSPTTITQLFFQTTDLDGNFKIGAPCSSDARECDATIGGVGQGSDAPFVVKCTPQSTGLHTASLHIATNTSQYVMVPISMTCMGVSSGNPVLSVIGDPVDAGDVEVINSTGSGALTLRNGGAGTLQIKGAQVTGSTSADWSYLVTGQCNTLTPPCNLTANQAVDLNVTFDPSAIGSRNASLLIQYYDTADRSMTVQLQGVGKGATLDLVGGPTTIDFGAVPLNVTSQLSFQLANQGNRDLLDVSLGVMAPAGPFTLSPPTMTTVAMGGMTTITASCRPTAIGTFTTTFTASAPDAFMSPPISIPATCQGTNSTVYSNPTSLVLGEIRTLTTPAPTPIMVLGTTAVTVTGFSLETPGGMLSLTGSPGSTPLTIQLHVDPSADGDLANAINIDTSAGPVHIPITGKVVTADFTVPPPTSLGTFCINAETTAGSLALQSIGTASIRLTAPRMDLTSSPFDLAFGTPSTYPATVNAGDQAVVAITPKRQSIASVQHDEIVWSTDVANMTTVRSMVSAAFVDDGGAIAPSTLGFGRVPIHLDTMNGQSVTLQNCDTTPIILDDPQIDPPFTVDSPDFPHDLAPNESATFSVGFHPTKLGMYTQTLTITSMQLTTPLQVSLSGEGVTGGGDGDGGTDDLLDLRSFYGCSGCTTREPGGGIVIVVAFGFALRRRRRAG